MDGPAVCPSCQTPLSAANRFCSHCGRSATSTAPAGSAAELQLHHVRTGLADRYVVKGVIGVGGMATVYLAQDRKHDRPVAIKVVHPALGAALGHERFLREVAIAARLNHPHVLLLIDSGEVGGLLYYVMPFVEGETLRARLVREGELPVTDAARILRDVADALAYAHTQGVVHRDVKPENILLAGRHALVADFGVAKAVSKSSSPDIHTTAGISVGTPAYMSPEQATADPQLDHRADLYALGVVGYEVLTGKLPISGKTPQEVLAAQVNASPIPLEQRRATVPPELARVIMRCLEKRPADRWQSAGELVTQLETFATPSAGFTPSGMRPAMSRKQKTTAFGVGLIAVAAIVAVILAVAQRDPPGALAVPRQLTFDGDVFTAAPSPDGRSLAFIRAPEADSNALYVRDLAGGQALKRNNVGHTAVQTLAWSPDGTELLFEGSVGEQFGAFRVSMFGGTPRSVIEGGVFHLWSPDASRVAYWWPNGRRLYVLTLISGRVDSLAVAGQYDRLEGGDWSPVDDRIAVITDASGSTTLRVTSLSTGQQVNAITEPEITGVVWNRDASAIYYAASGLLRKLAVNADGSARGAPVTLARLGSEPRSLRLTADGRRLVFTDARRRVNYMMYRAGAGSGAELTAKALTSGTTNRSFTPGIAPDGRSIAFAQLGPAGADLFRLSLDDASLVQLTFTAKVDVSGGVAWSADAKRLAFITRDDSGRKRVAVTPVDGSGAVRVYGATQPSNDLAWGPQDRILYQCCSNRNFRLLDPATSTERPLLPTDSAGYIFSPVVSSDGRSAAFAWNRRRSSGPRGTYAIPFNGDAPRMIDSAFIDPSGWSSDGEWLYGYRGQTGTLERVSNRGGPVTMLRAVPPRTIRCVASDRPSGLVFVCSEVTEERDAWVLENFDSGKR